MPRSVPNDCLLLVDTYDTLTSGVPNAITRVQRAARAEVTNRRASVWTAATSLILSRQARKMLDEAGFPNAKIFASGDLDEEAHLGFEGAGRSHQRLGRGHAA